jgi:glycosyltransferase involved in cell wall biosynthesis
MPCLLKARSATSPGIVTFTHNEVLNGVVRTPEVRSHLERTAGKSWLFGVHVQGDVSYLGEWPLAPWQRFVMWPDAEDPVFADLPPGVHIPLNCVNFLPPPAVSGRERELDICAVTRPSPVKRPVATLEIIKHLMGLRPEAECLVIAHDPRDLALGSEAYERQSIDAAFYEEPMRMFSALELARISFITSSTQSFGNFPLSTRIVSDLIGRSKLLLLTSHKEGTPRVIAEALMAGTPCAVSENLNSGLNRWLDDSNSLRLSDDPAAAAAAIDAALGDPGRFSIDTAAATARFGAEANLPRLGRELSRLIEETGCQVDGEWYLADLHLRLACHGQKQHSSLMGDDPSAWFSWLEASERYGPYDEDAVILPLGIGDPYLHRPVPLKDRAAALVARLRKTRGARG